MADYSDYATPEGLRVRGTVVVVPGRGETPATYARLGRRLASDAYRVRIVDPPLIEPNDIPASLIRLAHRLTVAIGAAPPGGAPVVLVGADTGAAAVAALVGSCDAEAPWQPDAVVVAGLPGYDARASGGWEDELDARTSCLVHRGELANDPRVRRGELAAAVPDALLDAAYGVDADIPHLVLVGDADPLADRDALTRAVKSLPRARLAVVRGAHHDVLNDLQHRSVAAEIVSFLEALRADLVPAIAVESSAW
jgi:pimeloyl-ACP methyl ester carboxylesterase